MHTICNDSEIAAREAGVRLLMLETFAPRPSLRSAGRARICLEAGRETARSNPEILQAMSLAEHPCLS